MRRIDPVAAFGGRLSSVAKPSRYLGGERGSILKPDARLRIALCFPDLYEIGMANNAMRILYSGLNAIEGVACERVFAVARDFGEMLTSTGTPLYGLESGTPLGEFDMVAFTVGYELSATNILEVLELGGIPVLAAERGGAYPILLAGGPAITNPAPYAEILDGVWIGEAEPHFFELASRLERMKAGGAGKADLLAALVAESSVWSPGKKAARRVYGGFANSSPTYRFPLPNVRPVQDHGIVEIMRGCPNGCRFCHAGYFYRPARYRYPDRIIEGIDSLVFDEGRKEISLSSLSSGDYPGIVGLAKYLKRRYRGRGVSFQLPSLKVESLPLPIIEELSDSRLSGLTFAVETPIEAGQLALNKTVALEKIHAILREALSAGYKLAKLYFMIGLPGTGGIDAEADAIIEALKELTAKNQSIRINCTVATFVPKPHTPFQRCGQLHHEAARQAIYRIKDSLRGRQQIKISYHNPYLSWLEGVVARGDERVGALLLDAHRRGAAFDAWDDLFDKEAWESALGSFGEVALDAAGPRSPAERLPWADVSIRVSPSFVEYERGKAESLILTDPCRETCASPCGACGPEPGLDGASEVERRISVLLEEAELEVDEAQTKASEVRVLFGYEKFGRAAYLAHHDLYSMLATAFETSGLRVSYSEGFHPMPRMEISEPLPLGFESFDEYGLVRIAESSAPLDVAAINAKLHADMRITSWKAIPMIPGVKLRSLSAAYWGSTFRVRPRTPTDVDACIINLTNLRDSDPRLADLEFEASEDGVSYDIKLRFAGAKELGIKSVLSTAFSGTGEAASYVVSRLRQFAKAADGGPCEYGEAF